MAVIPFPLVEQSLKDLILSLYPSAAGKIGGDPSYTPGQGFYIWLNMVPGSGRTDENTGEWAIDVEVFAPKYATAMTISLALEALLLTARGYRSSNGLIIDRIYQNTAPSERPWDDDATFLAGGTYVITARRQG